MELIKDTKKLMSAITSVHKMGVKYHVQLHQVACSVVFHAAEHGQVAPINAFYEGLKEAYQSAFRQWVGTLAGKASKGDDAWIDFKNKKFEIINDKMAPRKAFTDTFAELLKDKTKAPGKAFFEKDPRQGVNQFGDDQIVKMLINLTSRAVKAKENGQEIDDKLIAFLQESATRVQAIHPVVQ